MCCVCVCVFVCVCVCVVCVCVFPLYRDEWVQSIIIDFSPTFHSKLGSTINLVCYSFSRGVVYI